MLPRASALFSSLRGSALNAAVLQGVILLAVAAAAALGARAAVPVKEGEA